MRVSVLTISLCVIAGFAGCSRQSPDATTAGTPKPATTPERSVAASPSVDVCKLLTSEEVEAVQGEAVKDMKPTRQISGYLAESQCYFETATTSNSVVMNLTQANDASKRGQIQESWEKMFGDFEKEEGEEHEGKRERRGGEEEEEEGRAPLRVDGVGDEAFWAGGAIGGSLYVLHGDSFIRISVGGPGDATAKLGKARMLAELALKRL